MKKRRYKLESLEAIGDSTHALEVELLFDMLAEFLSSKVEYSEYDLGYMRGIMMSILKLGFIVRVDMHELV